MYVWHEGGHTLGQAIPIPIKQLTIDEAFWQRGRVDKSMAPHVIGDPTWVWALVEVYNNGKNGRCVFRIIRPRAKAIENKPRGSGELTRFVKCHAWPGNLVVSDGLKATRSIDWASWTSPMSGATTPGLLRKGSGAGP